MSPCHHLLLIACALLGGMGGCGAGAGSAADGDVTDDSTADGDVVDDSADGDITDVGTAPDAPGPAPDANQGAPDAPADGGPPITGAQLQLNDVSIVFPLPTDEAQRDEAMLSASTAGPRGELFSRAVYAAVGGRLTFNGSVLDYDQLRVVSARIDPCFGEVSFDPTGAGCVAQIRLVLQPLARLDWTEGRMAAGDAGVHTFYRLTRDEVYALKDALVALRLQYSAGESLGALGPHPLLVRDGLRSPFAEGLRQLIMQAAGSANLVRVATMSSSSTTGWEFKMFDIDSAGPVTATPIQVPAVATPTFTHALGANSPLSLASEFTPELSGPLAFGALATVWTADVLEDGPRQQAFDALIETENPRRVSVEAASCAGCHMTTVVKKLVAEPRLGLSEQLSPALFQADATVVDTSDLRPTFNITTQLNIHAFSYNGLDLAIMSRVVNETALVLEYFARVPAP